MGFDIPTDCSYWGSRSIRTRTLVCCLPGLSCFQNLFLFFCPWCFSSLSMYSSSPPQQPYLFVIVSKYSPLLLIRNLLTLVSSGLACLCLCCAVISFWNPLFFSMVLPFWGFFGFFFFFFMAVLCLLCCVQAFSSCSKWGLLFVAVRWLLIAVASLVAEHRL